MQSRIYLDSNATTIPDPDLVASYTSALNNYFGNPSSVHFEGQMAKSALVDARVKISRFFDVDSHEVLFTSSATEALNLILRGFFGHAPKGHVISSNLEHAAVFRTLTDLTSFGCNVTFLPGAHFGAVTPDQVERAIRSDTRLIVLMAVNNETGVITDIESIAKIAESRKIPFVVDGVALLGKAHVSFPKGVTAMVFSGHKFHAPKGTGFAIIRKNLKLHPLITGGEQEYGRRGGTEHVAAAIVLAQAVVKAIGCTSHASLHMATLRDHFEKKLLELYPFIKINGSGPRISNTSNILFTGIDGESLLLYVDLHGVSASMGSACASGTLEPTRVLLNMGLSQSEALSSLRFSLSRNTTQGEIDSAISIISDGIKSQLALQI